MKIACCIFSHNITRGMKSIGPIGILKKNNKSKSLIVTQIEYLRKIFKQVDIYVIAGFGHDKLKKALHNKKTVNTIINYEYDTKNYGYALKLFLNAIEDHHNQYDGLFFLDSNIVLRSLKSKHKNLSWVLVKKHKANTKNKDYLGVNINNSNNINHLFYNTGNHLWCKSFYLTKRDLKVIMDTKDMYHDNMFVFEIINGLIDQKKVKVYANIIENNSCIAEISGIKDKNKIK